MNAPVSDLGGVREALCHQEMIEQLGLVAVYAGVAQQLLDVGDSAGADYALRRMGCSCESCDCRAQPAPQRHDGGGMKAAPPLLAIADGRRARPRKAAGPAQSELRLHIDVADVLRRFCRPDWRWWHTPNGEHRDVRVAAKLKAMGVKPGIADFLMLGPGGGLRCLELKTANGRLSEAQEEFQAFCIRAGIPFVVARKLNDALIAFNEWGCLTHRIGGAV